MAIKILNRTGRSTFDYILTQIEDCIEDIKVFFEVVDVKDIYLTDYYESSAKLLSERPALDLKQLALCDIAYSIVFFGMGFWDRSAFLNLYLNHYNSTFLRYVSYYVGLKPHKDYENYYKWNNFKKTNLNIILEKLDTDISQKTFVSPNLDVFERGLNDYYYELIDKKPYKYYGGHQFKLGHYFRHLYQTVNYINEQNVFSYVEKYEYVKILRAQLSTPEQYLLFFNSLSKSGRNWELSKVSNGANFSNVNCYLLTKYNLIKNIPDLKFIGEIEIQNFYPLLQFEFSDKNVNRSNVKALFQ